MSDKWYFPFRYTWADAMLSRSNKDAMSLFKRIIYYIKGQDYTTINLTKSALEVWAFIESDLERSAIASDKANKRWNKNQHHAQHEAEQQPEQNTEHLPDNREHRTYNREVKKNTKKTTEESTSFQEFWKAYPLHKARQRALKAYLKINPDDETQQKIISAIEKQRERWTDPQYIPHPATWLNDRRWEDEEPTQTQQQRKGERIAQLDYQQREYEERPAGKLPAWLEEMMTEETQQDKEREG